MKITRLDHLVLTVKSIAGPVEFYQTILDMNRKGFGNGRAAPHFGGQNQFAPGKHHS
jgi:hypothetical protein